VTESSDRTEPRLPVGHRTSVTLFSGARTVLAVLGLAVALLSGCTTAIAGGATAVGDPQRRTESEEPEQSAEPEETQAPEETEPAPSSPETIACDFAADAIPSLGLLVNTAIFEENSGLFPVPTETRESSAQVIDAILFDTQPMLDALPAGAVREAFTVLRTESALLRDALRAPATGPLLYTVDDPLAAAFQAILTACEAA